MSNSKMIHMSRGMVQAIQEFGDTNLVIDNRGVDIIEARNSLIIAAWDNGQIATYHPDQSGWIVLKEREEK